MNRHQVPPGAQVAHYVTSTFQMYEKNPGAHETDHLTSAAYVLAGFGKSPLAGKTHSHGKGDQLGTLFRSAGETKPLHFCLQKRCSSIQAEDRCHGSRPNHSPNPRDGVSQFAVDLFGAFGRSCRRDFAPESDE